MNAYQAAYDSAIWVDHHDSGRIQLTDRDRLTLIHRMSTNELLKLKDGQAAVTVLTSPIGRIIDMLTVLNAGDQTIAITGRGRGDAIFTYFRRNIFYNDRVKIANLAENTHFYGLYGKKAGELLAEVVPASAGLGVNSFLQWHGVFILRVKLLDGFWLIGEPTALNDLHEQLAQKGVVQADRDTYDLLRIEAGYPDVGHELTEDYIPLEAGLWDAVSFNKGCYTGQEIIARMESRGKLAKVLVRLGVDQSLPDGSTLYVANEKVGTLTSLAADPMGHYLGLGFVKTAAATANLHAEDGTPIKIIGIAGVQPEKE